MKARLFPPDTYFAVPGARPPRVIPSLTLPINDPDVAVLLSAAGAMRRVPCWNSPTGWAWVTLDAYAIDGLDPTASHATFDFTPAVAPATE